VGPLRSESSRSWTARWRASLLAQAALISGKYLAAGQAGTVAPAEQNVSVEEGGEHGDGEHKCANGKQRCLAHSPRSYLPKLLSVLRFSKLPTNQSARRALQATVSASAIFYAHRTSGGQIRRSAAQRVLVIRGGGRVLVGALDPLPSLENSLAPYRWQRGFISGNGLQATTESQLMDSECDVVEFSSAAFAATAARRAAARRVRRMTRRSSSVRPPQIP
jgi:hypothetical protein